MARFGRIRKLITNSAGLQLVVYDETNAIITVLDLDSQKVETVVTTSESKIKGFVQLIHLIELNRKMYVINTDGMFELKYLRSKFSLIR